MDGFNLLTPNYRNAMAPPEYGSQKAPPAAISIEAPPQGLSSEMQGVPAVPPHGHRRGKHAPANREEISRARQKLSPNVRARNVYVGNLPSDCTAEMFRSMCEKFGTVESLRLQTDNGRCFGYGFCYFSAAEEAARCIESLDGVTFGSKALQARLADATAGLLLPESPNAGTRPSTAEPVRRLPNAPVCARPASAWNAQPVPSTAALPNQNLSQQHMFNLNLISRQVYSNMHDSRLAQNYQVPVNDFRFMPPPLTPPPTAVNPGAHVPATTQVYQSMHRYVTLQPGSYQTFYAAQGNQLPQQPFSIAAQPLQYMPSNFPLMQHQQQQQSMLTQEQHQQEQSAAPGTSMLVSIRSQPTFPYQQQH